MDDHKALLFRLLAAALSLALVLACCELWLRAVRTAPDFANTAVVSPNRHLARGLPDFRDRPRPGEKESGHFRLLAIGDSFTWGYGVQPWDAYPRRLETRLALLDSELEFEVISWSRSGWNTRQAWESVEPWLQWLEPDLVLLGFTLNDPEPSNRVERERVTEALQRRTPGQSWSRALHERSALYRLFWERFENRRQRRAFTSYYEGLFTGPHWRECLAAMKELRQATRAQEIPLVLVVMPVFDSQLGASYSYRRLHGKVAAAADELEIPALDLLGALRRVDSRRLAVRPFTDPHPSELAHRIAAAALTDYLVDEELVPASFSGDRRAKTAVRRR